MSEEYLWDRSGERDKEIVRLETVLGQLRWQGPQHHAARKNVLQWTQRRWLWAAAAAVLVIGVSAAAFLQRERWNGPVTSWRLSLSGGQPTAVRAGQVIKTTNSAHGVMESPSVGEVHIDPGSQVRLLSARDNEQRLALDHGTLHALIWAPPTRFVVDTPSARAVDLGCRYTLNVARDGTGQLTVEFGWVAFQWHKMESFIPAGAACTTRRFRGPGTPHFLDAPASLTGALDRFDSTGSRDALTAVLAAARPRDGLTLWHLLDRTQGTERAEVLDGFVRLVNLPPGVNRNGILAGDRKSMDAAWDALQLGNTSWWREWKRQW